MCDRIRKLNLWHLFKVALALSLMALVLSQMRIEALVALWQRIVLLWLPASMFAFFAVTWAMARRYWVLIRKCIPFPEILSIVVLQTALTNLIATIAGAVSYVAMLRVKFEIPSGQGVATLLMARFGDILVMLPFLIFSSLTVWGDIGVLQSLVLVLTILLVGVVFLVSLILIGRHRVVDRIKELLHWSHLDRFQLVILITKQLDEAASVSPGYLRETFVTLIGYSALTLGLSLVFAYCDVRLFDLNLSFEAFLFVNILTLLLSYVPIQVFGGLGVFEITTVYLYGLFGLAPIQSIPFVLSARLYFYLLNGILLLYPMLAERLSNRNQIAVKTP